MGLPRVGMVFFGVGLLVASLAAVVGGLACTEVACPGATVTLVPAGVDAVTGRIAFSDGCNTCTSGPGVAHGLALTVVGIVLGGVGVVHDLSMMD